MSVTSPFRKVLELRIRQTISSCLHYVLSSFSSNKYTVQFIASIDLPYDDFETLIIKNDFQGGPKMKKLEFSLTPEMIREFNASDISKISRNDETNKDTNVSEDTKDNLKHIKAEPDIEISRNAECSNPDKSFSSDRRIEEGGRKNTPGKTCATKSEFTVGDYIMKQIEYEVDDLRRKTLMCKNFSANDTKQIMDHFGSDHYTYAIDSKLRSLIDILEVVHKKSQIRNLSSLKRIRAKSLSIRKEAKSCGAWKNLVQSLKENSNNTKSVEKISVAVQTSNQKKSDDFKKNSKEQEAQDYQLKSPGIVTSGREKKDDRKSMEKKQKTENKSKSHGKMVDKQIPPVDSNRWRGNSRVSIKKPKPSYYSRKCPYSYESHHKDQKLYPNSRWNSRADLRRDTDVNHNNSMNYSNQYDNRAISHSDNQMGRFQPPPYDTHSDTQPLLRPNHFTPHYESSLDQNRYFNSSRDYNSCDMFKF